MSRKQVCALIGGLVVAMAGLPAVSASEFPTTRPERSLQFAQDLRAVRLGVVPKVVGYSEKGAEATLRQSGFLMDVAGTEASNYPKGTVVRQDPPEGKSAVKGSTVRVWTATVPRVLVPQVVAPQVVVPQVRVPEVRGRSVRDAETFLKRSGLGMRVSGAEQSNYPEGSVARQEPAAGARADRGSTVYVWTATVPQVLVPQVRVPEVRGRSVRDAETFLKRSGLGMRVSGAEQSNYPEGSVARQEPAAGARADRGSTVYVWTATVSLVTVPDLRGLSIDAARQRLHDNRLDLGATSKRPSLPPEGTIIGHNPGARAQVKAGSLVNIAVGDGSQVEVPRLAGQLEQAARETLKTARLRAGDRHTEESDGQEDRVLRQAPEAGSIVARGSTVDYWIAVPAAATVPSVEGMRTQEALTILESARLVGEQTGTEEALRPQGEIVRQEPAAGSRVPRGSRVLFWIASPVRVAVPDLSSMRGPDAVKRLLAAGLVAGTVGQEESEEAEGTVIDQNPQPAQRVPLGTPVNYRVASLVLIRVPSLINLSLDRARQELVGVHLVMTRLPAEWDNATRGTVIDQNPKPNTPVARGAEVIVRISAGPLFLAPWVIGGGIGAILLAAGAGIWRSRHRPDGTRSGVAAKPKVRVRLEGEEVDAEQGISLDRNVPEVRIRVRLERGESEVSARQLVAREERRTS